MYLQITTKCNMKCAHCCFSCEPGKGEDMSLTVFEATMRCIQRSVSSGYRRVVLGGGEPTLHPHFDRILFEALNQSQEVEITTNGTRKRESLLLANLLLSDDRLSVRLSEDEWHDSSMVDPEVREQLFANGASICTVELPTYAGRYLESTGYADYNSIHERCTCEMPFVRPDGYVKQCGCEESPVLGSVLDDTFIMPTTRQCHQHELELADA